MNIGRLKTSNGAIVRTVMVGEFHEVSIDTQGYLFQAEDIKELRKFLKKLQKKLEAVAEFYAKVDAMEESFPD